MFQNCSQRNKNGSIAMVAGGGKRNTQWAEIPCTPCNFKFLDKGMKLYEIKSNYAYISEHI